jgi:hypothetical protein
VTQIVGRLTVWVDRWWGGWAACIGEGWGDSGGRAYPTELQRRTEENDVVHSSYRHGALLHTRVTRQGSASQRNGCATLAGSVKWHWTTSAGG